NVPPRLIRDDQAGMFGFRRSPSNPAQASLRRQLRKIEMVEVVPQAKRGIFLTKAKGQVVRDFDDGHGMEEVYILGRDGMRGNFRKMKTSVEILGGVINASSLAGLSALQGNRGAEIRERRGLHPVGFHEIHHRAMEQDGQMEKPVIQTIDAG